jgi:hypothetical protein
MGPYVCVYLSECIYKTDQFPPVWKWIDPRTFWLSLFTPPNAPVSSRPQTNEGRVLAAQWSDMKDSETIKDIVPFFFSFGEDKVFSCYFLFSLASNGKKGRKTRSLLSRLVSRSPLVFGLLRDPSRACYWNIAQYSCCPLPGGSSSIHTDLLHLSSFSSFSNGNAMPVRQPKRKALLNLVVAWWRHLFIIWMESNWPN